MNAQARLQIGFRYFHLFSLFTFATLLCTPATAKKEALPQSIHWDESTPGCTFSRTPEGRYNYGLTSGDVAVTLSIDSQELEKAHHRHEPFFSVLVVVKNSGLVPIDVHPEAASLEFVRHFKVIQTSLDPDGFSQKVQNDADEFDRQIARDIAKHPDQKDTKQAMVRSYQKDAAELIEFLSKNALKPSHLDTGNRSVSGWILFNTQNKFVSAWKKQEDFIFRLPVADKIFEFPFRLPPKQGELLLRHRE